MYLRPIFRFALLFSAIGVGTLGATAQEKGFDLEVQERYSTEKVLEMEQKETLHKDTGKTVVVTGVVSHKEMSHNMETGEFLSTFLLEPTSGGSEERVECLPKNEGRIDELKKGMKVRVAGELAIHVGARIRYARFRIVEE